MNPQDIIREMVEARYFYTDSLAAAWMAKQFEMEFTVKGIKKVTYTDLLFLEETIDKRNLYVHPDSLHLLEPQVGDVIEFQYPEAGDKQVCMIIPKGAMATVYEQALEIDFILSEKDPSRKTIRRNGIAFMWPEKE